MINEIQMLDARSVDLGKLDDILGAAITRIEETLRAVVNVRIAIDTPHGILAFSKHDKAWRLMLGDGGTPPRGMRAAIFTEGWLAKLIVSSPAQLDDMIAGRRSAIAEAQRILVALKTVRPKEGTS